MVRLNKKTRLSLLLLTVIVGYWLVGCGCPEDDESRYKFEAFSISLTNNINNELWNEEFSFDLGYSYNSNLGSELSNYLGTVEIFNKEMLFDNYLFPFLNRSYIHIPEIFTNCTLTNISLEYICVMSESDTLFNSFSDTEIFVNNASSSIVRVKRSSDTFNIDEVLYKTESTFISENRYKISSFHNPNVKSDGVLYFQQSDVTREIVLDSAGSVINDLIYFREIFQNRLQNKEISMVIKYGTLNTNEPFPQFLNNEDSGITIYAFKNEVFLKESDSEWRKVTEGRDPKLFDKGSKILINSDDGYQVFDLNNDELIPISTQNNRLRTIDVSMSSNLVYYTESRLLMGFNPDDKTALVLKDFDNLENRIENNEVENYYYSLQPIRIIITSENELRLFFVSNSSYYFASTC